MPMLHIKASGPGWFGAVKTTVSELPKGTIFRIPSFGIVNDCVQPPPVVLIRFSVTVDPDLTTRLFGLYPSPFILIVAC